MSGPTKGAEDARTPFEAFALDFLAARGAEIEQRGALDWEAVLPPDLAKKWRRQAYRLVFDPDRMTLPRSGVFAAPGSVAGLRLLEVARNGGHVARFHALARPRVDARALAGEELVLHDVAAPPPKLGEPRHAVIVGFHTTLTFEGGSPEQDLRSVLVDPRGPSFDFWEPEERKQAELVPGFPEGLEYPAFDRAALWAEAEAWLERVLEPRAVRLRKKSEEGRERDLLRLNTFYQTRIQEERDRRRRRKVDEGESEEPATEAALKLEWGRRTRSVRNRYEPRIAVRLWGIEEIARPRQPVTYALSQGGKAVGSLEVEVDLAAGSLVRPPCPVCGRPAGEFWWEGSGLVCRRCRGRKPSTRAAAPRPAPARDSAPSAAPVKPVARRRKGG
ncbi:MAG: hypothetical protein ABI960_09705 [Candidatus Eisenbacteria bacterium]